MAISRYIGALANERCRYKALSVADLPYTGKWRRTSPVYRFLFFAFIVFYHVPSSAVALFFTLNGGSIQYSSIHT